MKILARCVATVLVAPLLAWYFVWSAAWASRAEQTFRGLSQLLAMLPGLAGSYVRGAFYRWTCEGWGHPCFIGFGTIFATREVSMGNRVYVGAFCNLGHVDISDDVMLGSNVTILSGQHQHGSARTDVPMNRQPGRFERVRVGRDCWLGNGAIVMADVSAGTIVAAGSVVTRAHPPYSVLAGNPARVIRSRREAAAG